MICTCTRETPENLYLYLWYDNGFPQVWVWVSLRYPGVTCDTPYSSLA